MKKIIAIMNWIIGITLMVSACAVDSASWFPTVVCALCMAYFGLAIFISKALKKRRRI